MGMSALYGPTDEAESIATVHAALEAGVTLLDTGDFYGMGHNELLLSRALQGRPRDSYLLSVKFDVLRGPGGEAGGVDARPVAVRNFLALLAAGGSAPTTSTSTGRRDCDPAVPIEETVGAIAEMVEAGHVRHIGLSEVGAETVRRAHAVHPIADVQIEYSLISRRIEDEILPTCRELGIGITAYGVLSRGLISGHWSPGHAADGDFRARLPRFRGKNLEHNLAHRRHPAAPGRVQGRDRRPAGHRLGAGPRPGHRAPRGRAVPRAAGRGARGPRRGPDRGRRVPPSSRPSLPDAAAGDRYDERQMAILDSEP